MANPIFGAEQALSAMDKRRSNMKTNAGKAKMLGSHAQKTIVNINPELPFPDEHHPNK